MRLVLGSCHPMVLFWGPELVQIYNDAFAQSCGVEARAPLGQPWACSGGDASVVRRHVDDVMRFGKPSWHDDLLVPLFRDGRLEEVYWTCSFSPVFDDDGKIGGTLVVTSETTARVLERRRARALRQISVELTNQNESSSWADVVTNALAVLRDARSDAPVTVALEIAEDGAPQMLRATVEEEGVARSIGRAVQEHLQRRSPSSSSEEHAIVELPPIELPGSVWPEPVTRAYVVTSPKSIDASVTEAIVFGLSPRLPFDDAYRGYLDEIVEKLTAARARIELSEARKKVGAARSELLRHAPVPTVFSTGLEQRIDVASESFIELVGGRDPVGKTFAEAFPHLVGSDLERTLRRAYETGDPITTDERIVPEVNQNDSLEERWLKLSVQPVRDSSGRVYGLISTEVDLTEAVKARRAVEACSMDREKLLVAIEAASRSKDEFLAMLGHELRNPLAPIITALHLMKLKEPTALVREREIIQRQAEYLVKLVDDLLDVARVVRGKITLHCSRIALADVIARAVETATPLFEEKRHAVTIDVSPQGFDVEGDPLRLGQVFANLLTNAAKFTEAGGRISVRAARDGDFAVIRVEDNGVGIPEAQLPYLFDAFFQVPREPERAQRGLGLGLALVKSFVTLHGGTVSARNRKGGGSVFEVRLRLFQGASAPAHQPEKKAAELPNSVCEKRRILLVDDSEDILDVVASFLRHEGYEVMAAHDAPSALRIAPSFHPNIAVLDIGLPVMDGYELAQHLREELGDEAPKLIAMTGYGQEADRERARRAGFASHLVKPVDPKKLLESLRA